MLETSWFSLHCSLCLIIIHICLSVFSVDKKKNYLPLKNKSEKEACMVVLNKEFNCTVIIFNRIVIINLGQHIGAIRLLCPRSSVLFSGTNKAVCLTSVSPCHVLPVVHLFSSGVKFSKGSTVTAAGFFWLFCLQLFLCISCSFMLFCLVFVCTWMSLCYD